MRKPKKAAKPDAALTAQRARAVDVVRELRAKKLRSEVHAAVGRLPKKESEVIIGRAWLAESTNEIARRLGVSQKEVLKLQRSALSRLRKDLKKRGVGL